MWLQKTALHYQLAWVLWVWFRPRQQLPCNPERWNLRRAVQHLTHHLRLFLQQFKHGRRHFLFFTVCMAEYPTPSYFILSHPTTSYLVLHWSLLPAYPYPVLPYPTPAYTLFYGPPTASYLVLHWILLPAYPVLLYPIPSYHILPRPGVGQGRMDNHCLLGWLTTAV